ncbi:MAG: DUF1501 domain-containing protein [Verrucomicrobiales bacterium]
MISTDSTPFSRRHALKEAACGFGYLAFAGLAGRTPATAAQSTPLIHRPAHFPERAKRVIFLFMDGGPSQMDTFDPKPELAKRHGEEWRKSTLFKSHWDFKQHGESGLWVSEIFPELAKRHADDLCVIKSMHGDTAAHPTAVPFFHTGSFQFTRPSMGSWILYGLGSENENLPGFITINPSEILGGAQNYGSAFLPACYQGTRIGRMGQSVKDVTVKDIESPHLSRNQQRQQLDFIQRLNRRHLDRRQHDPHVEGVIGSLELGARMQDAVPAVMDLSGESKATRDLYGIDDGDSDNFGRMCLMARRYAERGVRFIQLTHTNWDQHRKLKNDLELNGRQTDRPIAGLLTDLKARGLLEDTLVVWSGEFGRLPEVENGDGRSHNASGFTTWLAGGGVKGGFSYGETDEIGYEAVENPVHVHDLHATILHLLGLDHKELTFRYSGRDFRLTDVHGNVVTDILA